MSVKFLSLKKLKEIRDNSYTSPAGKCYWDHQDTINERIWKLEDRRMEEAIAKRIYEEEEQEFYNFKLKDPSKVEWIVRNFDRLTEEGFFNKK